MSSEAASTFEALPPPHVRLRDWRDPEQRIIPTADERGFIDPYKLVEDVKETIDPSHEWSRRLDVHHFYWPRGQFPSQKFELPDYDTPPAFRNLSIHKGLIPRDFHNWLHVITEPPEIPDVKDMNHRIEAWTIARELFRMAKKTVVSERQAKRRKILVANHPELVNDEFDGVDIIGEEVMQDVLDTCFRGFKHQMERQNNLPKEHRLVDFEGTPAEIARNLGRIVVPKTLKFTHALAA